MSADIERKVAIVTGAAGGIGRQIVLKLASAGAYVLATDLDLAPVKDLFSQQTQAGSVYPLAADLKQYADYERIVRAAVDTFGHLDILVNNAAFLVRHDALAATVDEWDIMVTVNLKAAFFLAQKAAARMATAPAGRIINVSSQAGHSGGAADCPIYAITKGGLITMTRALARAFAPNGITVNSVAPGIVMTDMISGTLSAEQIKDLLSHIPIGRATNADEIAEAVLFLASNRAASITGHVLDVNGGMLMR
jgi:NAD(P)-dependent dehydrogenase (short-subunit alcohol dehydrogenase family)